MMNTIQNVMALCLIRNKAESVALSLQNATDNWHKRIKCQVSHGSSTVIDIAMPQFISASERCMYILWFNKKVLDSKHRGLCQQTHTQDFVM